MPLYIDPAWEYFEPDPEVAEAVYGNQGKVSVLDRVTDGRLAFRGSYDNQGLRFGRGNPDDFNCRLGQEKPSRAQCKKTPRAPSPGHPARPKPVVTTVTCVMCSSRYKVYNHPTRAQLRGFCTTTCYTKHNEQLIHDLYISGVTLDSISEQVGACRDTVKRILRRTPDLPRRHVGWKPKRDGLRKLFTQPVSPEEVATHKRYASLPKQPGNRRGRAVQRG